MKPQKFRINSFLENLFFATLSGIFAFILSIWAFKETFKGILHNAIPLNGDGLLIGGYLRILLSSSYNELWMGRISSTHFGWPDKLDFSAYPLGNLIDLTVIKFIASILKLSDVGQLIHFFSISKSFVIAFISYLVAERILTNKSLSLFVAIIFTTSSYNLIRAEGHFLLSLTWTIPLSILVIYESFNKFIFHTESDTRTPLSGTRILVCGLFIGLSGYYYAIFALLLLVGISFTQNIVQYRVERFSRGFHQFKKQNSYYIRGILSIGLGFAIQVIPILIKQKQLVMLSSTADRSPTEAFIFSGNLESIFSEPVKFFLHLVHRYDLIAYVDSQIQWESTQVGLIPSIILLSAIVLFVFKIINMYQFDAQKSNLEFTENNIRKNQKYFLFISIILALALYFRSPINFSISRLLPQIRAWGRMEIFLSFLLLLAFANWLKYNSKAKISVFLVAFLAIHYTSLSDFRNSRVSSLDLNNIAVRENANTSKSLEWLNAHLSVSCAIGQIPIYPFPEFDYPNDSNIDYGLLKLPLATNNFKWSYGGIKSTSDFQNYQNLISEVPNFSRADLVTQIQKFKSLGACGTLIDKTYLNNQENVTLSELTRSANRIGCINNLPGERVNGESRYIYLSLSGQICNGFLNAPITLVGSKPLALLNIDYKIDTPYSKGISDLGERFDIGTQVFGKFVMKHDGRLLLRVSYEKLNGKVIDSPQVCIQVGTLVKECVSGKQVGEDIFDYKFTYKFVRDKLYSFVVQNSRQSSESYNYWSLRIFYT